MSRDRHPGYDCEPLKEPWLSRSEALLDELEAEGCWYPHDKAATCYGCIDRAGEQTT